jgi:bifunctional DNA-binding transcriptional regulator/antitoxin component of YhaV-PrlF toxin-antitoxin module
MGVLPSAGRCGTFISESKEVREKGVQKMLAKLTSKNQVTIPKKVLSELGEVEYFDVEYREGVVVLKPVKVYESDVEGIRAKMRKLGLSRKAVAEAVRWARRR